MLFLVNCILKKFTLQLNKIYKVKYFSIDYGPIAQPGLERSPLSIFWKKAIGRGFESPWAHYKVSIIITDKEQIYK